MDGGDANEWLKDGYAWFKRNVEDPVVSGVSSLVDTAKQATRQEVRRTPDPQVASVIRGNRVDGAALYPTTAVKVEKPAFTIGNV